LIAIVHLEVTFQKGTDVLPKAEERLEIVYLRSWARADAFL